MIQLDVITGTDIEYSRQGESLRNEISVLTRPKLKLPCLGLFTVLSIHILKYWAQMRNLMYLATFIKHCFMTHSAHFGPTLYIYS